MFKILSSLMLMSLLTFPVYAGNGCCPNDGDWDYCSNEGYLHCDDGSVSKVCTCKNIPDPVPSAKLNIDDSLFNERTVKRPYPLFEKFALAGLNKSS